VYVAAPVVEEEEESESSEIEFIYSEAC